MLWLEIMGVLFLYGFVQNAIQEGITKPYAKRHSGNLPRLLAGCVWVLTFGFCVLAVFSFWILWLTGNPI